MKIKVCKGCGQVIMGTDNNTNKPVCLTCIGISEDSSIPVEVDVPEKIECDCGCGSYAIWKEDSEKYELHLSARGGWSGTYGTRIILVSAKHIPFLDVKNSTFYCGCYGWD